MKLWKRRLVYLIFIFVFFLIVPCLIFYTAGYKFNFKKLKIEKTGILVLETKPKGADIFIDSKLIKTKTPAQLNNFFPNVYHIRLEKEGYHPWQKNLEIKSNLTTFAKGIILFKRSLPILKNSGPVKDIYLMPKKDQLLYLTENDNLSEIRLWDLKNDQSQLIYQFSNNEIVDFNDLLISSGQNKILIPIKGLNYNKYLIFDTANLEVIDLSDKTKINFELVRWDNISEDVIYGYKSGIIYQIDLSTNVLNRLTAALLVDFLVKDFQIYYIAQDNLLTRESIGQAASAVYLKLPTNSFFSFDQNSKDYLTLIDKKNQDLIILDSKVFEDSENLVDHIILQAKANKVVWTTESHNLLYYNDFELWVYNFDSQESNLLTRLGEEIEKSYWYTDNKYVVYQTNNKVRIIELDPRDKRNDLIVAQIEEISDSILDDKGNKIYFSAQIGKHQGIFELEIR